MLPEFRLSLKDEQARYEKHNNDVNDTRYQQFVMPIVEAVLSDYAASHKGLDFGAGTGPVISKMLMDAGYCIKQYDPFFYPNVKLLSEDYDYIVCCEVIEHFRSPSEEFARLRYMLKPCGKIYCMTQLYDDSTNFREWHYMRDPTHHFFYHNITLTGLGNSMIFQKYQLTTV